MYDDEVVLGQYLDFHFGPSSDYPVTCANRCVELMRKVGQPMRKALEVGAGPGRASMELSKAFDQVQSGDYSEAFVNLGKKLVAEGNLEWKAVVDRTAGTVVDRSVTAKELGVGNVSFATVDAHNLPEDQYDLICGFNLLIDSNTLRSS